MARKKKATAKKKVTLFKGLFGTKKKVTRKKVVSKGRKRAGTTVGKISKRAKALKVKYPSKKWTDLIKAASIELKHEKAF